MEDPLTQTSPTSTTRPMGERSALSQFLSLFLFLLAPKSPPHPSRPHSVSMAHRLSPPSLTRHYDSRWDKRRAESSATQMPLSRGFRPTQVLLSGPSMKRLMQIGGIETRDSTCPLQGASLGPFMRLRTKGVTNTTRGVLGLSKTKVLGYKLPEQ